MRIASALLTTLLLGAAQLAAQSTTICAALNELSSPGRYGLLAGDTYAVQVDATAEMLVTGFRLRTARSSSWGGNALPVAIHLATTSGAPQVYPVRTATMQLLYSPANPPVEFRSVSFNELRIAAGQRFFIVISIPSNPAMEIWQSRGSSSSLPKGTHYFLNPANQTWIGPITTDEWVYIVDCSDLPNTSSGGFDSWTGTFLGNSGSSAKLTAVSSGGNPGNYAQAQTIAVAPLSGVGHAFLVMTRPTLVWNPATDGAFSSLGMTVDVKPVAGFGIQAVAPALIQGGNYYVAISGASVASSDPAAWRTISLGARKAVDFMRIYPIDSGSHPNFSTSGAQMTLGFCAVTSAALGNGVNITMGYDNIRLTFQRSAITTKTGLGCAGSGGIPSADVDGLCVTGGLIRLILANAPASGTAALYLGASDGSWGSQKLPYDLGGIGMTGCKLMTSPDLPTYVGIGKGNASVSILIPNNPALKGAPVFSQWLMLDPGANLLGVTASDLATLIIG